MFLTRVPLFETVRATSILLRPVSGTIALTKHLLLLLQISADLVMRFGSKVAAAFSFRHKLSHDINTFSLSSLISRHNKYEKMMIRRLHVLQGILLLLAVYFDSGVLAEAEVNFDDAGESGRDQLEALLNGEGDATGEDGSNSTETTEAPSSLTAPGTTAPTTYEEYVYNYDEVVGIEYAKPGTENWPSDEVWESGLRDLLSPGASLIDNSFVNNKVAYDFLCLGLEGYDMLKEGNGVCMIDEDCKFRFCGRDGNGVFNLPAYTVDPRSVQDIQAAVRFANQHNIQVSVKNTGHSKYFRSLNFLPSWRPYDILGYGFADIGLSHFCT